MTDCSSQGNLFRRKDFNQDTLLSKAYYIGHVWSGNLIKEQWYTNGCSYFLRTSLNVSLERSGTSADEGAEAQSQKRTACPAEVKDIDLQITQEVDKGRSVSTNDHS